MDNLSESLTNLNNSKDSRVGNETHVDGNTPIEVFLSAEGSASRGTRTQGNQMNYEMVNINN